MGKDEEMTGRLVSRLWMSGFFCLRVRMVAGSESVSEGREEMAASHGDMITADEVGCRIARHSFNVVNVLRCCAWESGGSPEDNSLCSRTLVPC